MSDDDDRAQLIAFAQQVGSPDKSGEETAKSRGWLDDDGNITDEGRKTIKSLGDQAGTRSVFR